MIYWHDLLVRMSGLWLMTYLKELRGWGQKDFVHANVTFLTHDIQVQKGVFPTKILQVIALELAVVLHIDGHSPHAPWPAHYAARRRIGHVNRRDIWCSTKQFHLRFKTTRIEGAWNELSLDGLKDKEFKELCCVSIKVILEPEVFLAHHEFHLWKSLILKHIMINDNYSLLAVFCSIFSNHASNSFFSSASMNSLESYRCDHCTGDKIYPHYYGGILLSNVCQFCLIWTWFSLVANYDNLCFVHLSMVCKQ